MTPYSSISGNRSGVTAYRAGKDYILVAFENKLYKYSYKSCGKEATEKMKSLAEASKGLSTYIAQYDPAYE